MRGVEQIPWLYDAMCAVMEFTGLKKWRAWLVGGARGRTLEVGCGTGRNLARYGELPALVAIEPDADALEKAKGRRGQALLVRASAEALPFRAGAFDTVVSSLVFCSVPRAEVGLAEVKRVLAADGTVRMLEHVRDEGWYGRVQDAIQPAWTKVAGGCHPNRRTEQAVESAGFTLSERRANGTMRRFVAKPPSPLERGEGRGEGP
ncbi:MAG: class I SAM-dependent methyltransferase [Myxococcaceae bacterium]